ncbi:MAG: cobalamin B12-binding domain-containing protein [Chloroflexi bacterium]|nr:cobalamin B12-binding domain-containing protein [Chloroflexota bacterium]
MPKVILINPNQMKPAVAPVGLDYLGDALQRAGFDAEVLDLCWSEDPLADIRRRLEGERAAAVGFTIRNTDDCYFASQDYFLSRYKLMLETVKASSQAPVVLGGAGFSVMPEAVLDYCEADLGIWGEGEAAFVELVTKLAQGESIYAVPGLVYHRDGNIQRNRPAFMPLHAVEAPARSLIDNSRYLSEGGQGSIETKRGCSKGCVYCADPVSKGRSIRLRSPASVADEIENLLARGVDCLHFCDSEFNVPDFHARAVCEEMARRGLGAKVRWYTYASPVPFDDDLAGLMRLAGCVGINFGADSGCDRLLRRLGRDFVAADLVRTADICRRHGLVFMCDLLLGGPGETRDTLGETIDLMRRIAPDCVGAAVGLRVYPNTAFARWLRGQGPIAANPNLQGAVADNESFVAPIYFVNAELGENPLSYVAGLIGGDQRFFVGSREEAGQNYNYNDNSLLVNAIRSGRRGAYWDILRRLRTDCR